MSLWRTEKAREELRPGVRTLSQKQRSLLLLADGRKEAAELNALFGGEGAAIVAALLKEGFLERRGPAVSAPAPPSDPARSSADRFEGKRSLASTRMFLFDLCERMFARRDAALAESFREQLREARDRDSMLAVGHAMLVEVEEAAGFERAEAIRERIELLLPREDAPAS